LTLGGLIGRTARRLRAARLRYGHGTDNPRDEAAFLVLRGLGLPFESELDAPVDASQRRRIEALAERRIRERIPVAYLLHEAWLADTAFYVDERALVPRAFISELLPARLRPWLPRRVRAALDLCTGSGCLAVLLARAFPRARVDATDVSAAALAVAGRNVARHRLGRRIRLVRSDGDATT
jgi:ribosomal protein L3 glutamine methyltransferase